MSRMEDKPTLTILSMVYVPPPREGRYLLTRKFVDGVLEYMKSWPGPVTVLTQPAERPSSDLDHCAVEPSELPFKFAVVRYTDSAALQPHVAPNGVVLAALDFETTHLPGLCRQRKNALVYVTEYTLRTRKQIVRIDTPNPIVRLRRYWWQHGLERRFRGSVGAAAGVQSNGTPTYEAYQAFNPRTLLFFDTRVTRDLLASDDVLNERTKPLLAGAPLRLAFSGRLIGMKGVDHLCPVAAELERRGVPFTLDIFGSGALEPTIREQIQRLGLGDRVRLRGTVDFRRELMPAIAGGCDLFLCCHRQGDPSCTYLETMSCGTPIIGYDNEAFAGLSARSGLGWVVEMDRVGAMAERIVELHRNRAALAAAAVQVRDFAARHTFEQTGRQRVEHMLECRRALMN